MTGAAKVKGYPFCSSSIIPTTVPQHVHAHLVFNNGYLFAMITIQYQVNQSGLATAQETCTKSDAVCPT